jgi:phage RecT family recombinase
MTAEAKDAPKQDLAVARLTDILAANKGHMQAMLGKKAKAEQLFAIALTAFSRVPKLKDCTGASVLGCILEATRMRLPVGVPGGVWLIPRENKKAGVMECTMVVDYRAHIVLMKRDAGVKTVMAERVHMNDTLSYGFGEKGPYLTWKPAVGDRGALRGYLAGSWGKDGTLTGYIFKTAEEVDKESKSRSMATADGPWKTDPDWMYKKSVIRPLAKFNPGHEESDVSRAANLDERAELGLPQNLHLLVDPAGVPNPEEERTVPMPAPAPQTYAEKVAWFGNQFAKLNVAPEAFARYMAAVEKNHEAEDARIAHLKDLAEKFKKGEAKPDAVFAVPTEPAPEEKKDVAAPLKASFKVHSVSDSDFDGEEAVAVRTADEPQRKFFAPPAMKALFAEAKKAGTSLEVTYEVRRAKGAKTDSFYVKDAVLSPEKAA